MSALMKEKIANRLKHVLQPKSNLNTSKLEKLDSNTVYNIVWHETNNCLIYLNSDSEYFSKAVNNRLEMKIFSSDLADKKYSIILDISKNSLDSSVKLQKNQISLSLTIYNLIAKEKIFENFSKKLTCSVSLKTSSDCELFELKKIEIDLHEKIGRSEMYEIMEKTRGTILYKGKDIFQNSTGNFNVCVNKSDKSNNNVDINNDFNENCKVKDSFSNINSDNIKRNIGYIKNIEFKNDKKCENFVKMSADKKNLSKQKDNDYSEIESGKKLKKSLIENIDEKNEKSCNDNNDNLSNNVTPILTGVITNDTEFIFNSLKGDIIYLLEISSDLFKFTTENTQKLDKIIDLLFVSIKTLVDMSSQNRIKIVLFSKIFFNQETYNLLSKYSPYLLKNIIKEQNSKTNCFSYYMNIFSNILFQEANQINIKFLKVFIYKNIKFFVKKLNIKNIDFSTLMNKTHNKNYKTSNNQNKIINDKKRKQSSFKQNLNINNNTNSQKIIITNYDNNTCNNISNLNSKKEDKSTLICKNNELVNDSLNYLQSFKNNLKDIFSAMKNNLPNKISNYFPFIKNLEGEFELSSSLNINILEAISLIIKDKVDNKNPMSRYLGCKIFVLTNSEISMSKFDYNEIKYLNYLTYKNDIELNLIFIMSKTLFVDNWYLNNELITKKIINDKKNEERRKSVILKDEKSNFYFSFKSNLSSTINKDNRNQFSSNNFIDDLNCDLNWINIYTLNLSTYNYCCNNNVKCSDSISYIEGKIIHTNGFNFRNSDNDQNLINKFQTIKNRKITIYDSHNNNFSIFNINLIDPKNHFEYIYNDSNYFGINDAISERIAKENVNKSESLEYYNKLIMESQLSNENDEFSFEGFQTENLNYFFKKLSDQCNPNNNQDNTVKQTNNTNTYNTSSIKSIIEKRNQLISNISNDYDNSIYQKLEKKKVKVSNYF